MSKINILSKINKYYKINIYDKIDLITFVVIFTIIVIISIFTTSKESLTGMNELSSDMPDLNPVSSFCKSYLGNSADLEPACNKLTQKKCRQTSCCVFSTNATKLNDKCVAGNIHGPTYTTDKTGLNTYYFQGKLYGQ